VGGYMGDCFVGCDICQEVCPYNKDEKGRYICLPSTDEILGMGDEAFKELYGKTALSRPGPVKIKDNIKLLKDVIK
jgi:epoxyqueuosine reductase QueG